MTGRELDERMAGILRAAASLIRHDGYNPKAGYEREPGYTITGALCRAARCERGGQASGAHDADCDQAHARVAGYLYLTGRAGASAGRPAAEALAVLDGAAAILGAPRGPRCGARRALSRRRHGR